MSLVECVPNPNAVAASADCDRRPAYGVAAGIVRAAAGSVIDDGSGDVGKRCPGVGNTDDRTGGMPLAGQAVGIRFGRLIAGRFRMEIVGWADVASFGCLIVPMRERMMLRPVSGHDGYQAEETNPDGHHRDQ